MKFYRTLIELPGIEIGTESDYFSDHEGLEYSFTNGKGTVLEVNKNDIEHMTLWFKEIKKNKYD